MRNLYIPYLGKKPATLKINGHNLLILSEDHVQLEDGMDLVGADRLKKISTFSDEQESIELDQLAKRIHGGIVVAPDDVDLDSVITGLKTQLPWIQ